MRSVLRVSFFVLGLLVGAVSADEAPIVHSVEAIGVTVGDLDRSVDFYTRILGFEKVSEKEHAGAAFERMQGVFGARARVATLKLGRETLELTQYLAPEGRPMPADTRGNDRWFQHIAIAVRDMDEAYAHLRRHKVRHGSSGPQTLPDWNPAAGGIKAFYFKDVDGHFLEVIWFPRGKGDPRWQEPTEKLFLGIDHTAIAVADTEASLKFYRDALGLERKGESENWGDEQEHLNLIHGARLRITLLKAKEGPGIELLEYLAPGDGRPYPADSRANDLWHWQVRLRAEDAAAAAKRARAAGTWVSPGAVDLPDATRAALVRDPDGHALLLEQSGETR